jgi:hypothetical protein
VSVAAPVGKPLMLVALKPKPMLPGAADAGAASRSTAASTAGTSAMTLIFIFQVLPCCHRELVADTAETQRLLRPPSQLLNIKHEHLSRRPGERRRKRSERRLGRRPDRPFRREHPTARRRPRHRTMHQCHVPGKPYSLPATLLATCP